MRRVVERVLVRLEQEPVGVAAVVLIALQLVVRLVVVLPSYFWQDDFTHLLLARRMGLSKDYLVRDYNDHLEIVTNALYWLVSVVTDRSFVLPALLVCGLQLLASVLFWRLLRAAFGSRGLILVALALYLFTPLALATSTWFAAALQALAYQLTLFAVLLAMLHLHRTGSRRWGIASLAAYAVGLLWWEKAALVLPTALVVLVLVVWQEETWGWRMQRLRQQRRWWAAHAVLLGAYLVLYFTVTDGSERTTVEAAPYLRSTLTMVAQVFVPGVIGGPWQVSGAENTLYPTSGPLLITACGLVLAAVIAASLLVSGRRALVPWAVALLYLAGDIALMIWGRAEYLGLVARDPRYVADAVPVFALCLAAAFTRSRERGPLPDRPLVRGSASTATALLVASGLLTTFLLAPVLQRTYAHNYVDGLIRGFEDNPGVSVVDTDTPLVIATLDQKSLLESMGFDAPFDQPGVSMRMFDSLAQLRETDLLDTTLDRVGPSPDCGWPVGRASVVIGDLPASSLNVYVLRLGVVTGVSARLFVEVQGRRQAVDVEPGLSHVDFVVSGSSGPILAWARRTGSGVCVSDQTAGRPWPRD